MWKTGVAAVAAILVTLPVFAHDGVDHGKGSEGHHENVSASAGTYIAEPTHAYITFTYNHLGFANPTLAFRKFDATIDFNPDRPDESTVEAVIDAASIESLVPALNEHLRAPDLFDVEKFPEITFRSTGALKISSETGKLSGDLTIKGITKPVTLDVTLNKAAVNPISKNETLGISATAELLRSDWELDAYAPAVSDEVQLRLEIEFAKIK